MQLLNTNNSPETSCALATSDSGKVQLAISISQDRIDAHDVSARNIIKETAQKIKGGGGGQVFFATAGGKNPDGIPEAFVIIKEYINQNIS